METKNLVHNCRKWFHRAPHSTESLYDETDSVLGALAKRYPLGMLTDGKDSTQRMKISILGLKKYFNHILIVSGNDEKPSSKGFIRICHLFQVKPGEALFVGENPYRDVLGASSVKMKVVWLRRKNGWECKEPPDELRINANWEISDLRHLFEVLKKLE